MTSPLYTLFMSNQVSITVERDNTKPKFIIRKGDKAIGSFVASLVDTGHKGVGSVFTAIVMRVVTGFPVNVIGKMLMVDGESIVGDNFVTEALRAFAQDPFYDGKVPMTCSTIYHGIEKGNDVRFLDDQGGRISTMKFLTDSTYEVSYSKQAN